VNLENVRQVVTKSAKLANITFSIEILNKVWSYTHIHTIFTNLGAIEAVQEKFRKIEKAVRIFDANFADFLFTQLSIEPLLFAFQWVSLLFAQSLELKELLHFWDHLLVFNEKIVDFVMMVAAAYLLYRKKTLMRMDYDNVMTELHAAQEMNFMTLLRIARPLWDQMNQGEST
jgi:hypothetical protein